MYSISQSDKTKVYIVFIFLWFFIHNFFIPIVFDDVNRSNIAALYNHTIVQNLIFDYQNWTGRMFAQFLVYVFLNPPYEWFLLPCINFLTAVSVTLIFYYFFRIVVPEKYKNDKTFLFLFFIILLLSCFNSFLRTTLFKTTGLQYILGMAALFWFFHKEYFRTSQTKNQLLLSGSLGFLLGIYNEVYFAVILISYCFLLVYYWLVDRSKMGILSKDTLFFMSLNLITGLFSVLAPGNYNRKMLNYPETIGISWKESLFLWWRDLFPGATAVHLAMILMGIAFFCFFYRRKLNNKKDFLTAFLFVGYSFSLFLMFLPIGGTGLIGRKLILHYFIFLFFIFYFSPSIWSKISHLSTFKIRIMQVFCLLIFGIYSVGIYDFHRYHLYLMEEVRLQKDQEIVIVKDHKLLLKSLIDDYALSEDISNWTNHDFAKYYKIKAIKIKK